MEYFVGYVIGGVLLLVIVIYGAIPNLKCFKNKFGGKPCDEHEQFPGT
jgi:hypothetical protein